MIKAFISIIVCLFLANFAYAQNTTNDYKDIYTERLVQWMNANKKLGPNPTPEAVEEVGKLSDNFFKFTKEYPGSRFAKDSVRVVATFYFIADLSVSDKVGVQKWLKRMEDLAAIYPNSKLEDFTTQKLNELGANFAPETNNMSNSDLALYMQANVAVLLKDYEQEIKYYSLLINKFDQINDSSELFVKIKKVNYLILAGGYNQVGKKDEAIQVLEDASVKFGEDQKFQDTIKRFKERISNSGTINTR